MKITIPEGTSMTIHNEGCTTHEVDFGRRTRRGPMTEERWNTIQALLVEGLGDDEAEQAIAQLRSAVVVADAVSTSGTVDDQAARLELQDIARGPCHCSGWRCSKHLALDEIERKRPRRVAVIGMRHLVAELNAAYAELTADACIVLGMFDGVWEGEGPHDGNRAYMHQARIDAADEVFVVNYLGQVDKLVADAIEYAELSGKPIRWLEPPAEMCRWCERPIRLKDGQTLDSMAYRSDTGWYAHKTCMDPHRIPTGGGQ